MSSGHKVHKEKSDFYLNMLVEKNPLYVGFALPQEIFFRENFRFNNIQELFGKVAFSH